MVAYDRSENVIDLRSEFQGAMSEDLTSDIERLTGRKVIAFMSANHIDPTSARNCSSSRRCLSLQSTDR